MCLTSITASATAAKPCRRIPERTIHNDLVLIRVSIRNACPAFGLQVGRAGISSSARHVLAKAADLLGHWAPQIAKSAECY